MKSLQDSKKQKDQATDHYNTVFSQRLKLKNQPMVSVCGTVKGVYFVTRIKTNAKYRDRQALFFLTNHFKLSAKTIANIYKARWQVELFFKWIKQNLK